MFCPKCGEKNAEGAKFCSKCGTNFEDFNKPVKEDIPIKNEIVKSKPKNSENIMSSIFKYMLMAFIKPFSTFKNNEKKLQTTSFSLIYSGIVCGIMWILSIISTIFSAAKTTSYTYLGGTVTTWSFARIQYIKIIFVNLLVYTAIFAAIAGVYFLASMIIKKTVSFFKMLSITATSMMPYIIATVFLAPIFGLIHTYVGAFIGVLGLVYSILIFLGLIDQEIEFKSKDQKLYFHAACVGLLALIFYFTFINFGTMNVISNKSLLDYAKSKLGF